MFLKELVHFFEGFSLIRVVVSVVTAAEEHKGEEDGETDVDEDLLDLAQLVLLEYLGSSVDVDILAVISPELGAPFYRSFHREASCHDTACTRASHHLE